MNIKQNKQIVEKMFASLNGRDLDGVVAYCAPECQFYGWAPETLDTRGYKENMSALLEAFPDSSFPVADVIAEGDRVAVRHHFRGTHKAPFQGVPATNKSAAIDAIAIFHMDHGKAKELWLSADFMGLLQQLGVVPIEA